MVVIETFVFFDVEATGVPERENNETKITEVAFLAVSRQSILNATSGNTPSAQKLKFYVNPQRPITQQAKDITGLTEDMLRNYENFKTMFPKISEFLSALNKPACLVSHGGNLLDFPVLVAECRDAGVSIPDVYCVDSFGILRDIDRSVNYRSLVVNCRNTPVQTWDGSKKLTELYKRFCNLPPKSAHNAEADCTMLLQICAALKKQFVRRADLNATPLSRVASLR